MKYCKLGKLTQCKVSGTIENKNDVYRQFSDMLYIRKPGETSIDFLLEDVKHTYFPNISSKRKLKISDHKNLCTNLNIGMIFPETFGLARGLLSTWGR